MTSMVRALEKYQAAWDLSSPAELAKTATSAIHKVQYRNSPAVLKILTEFGQKFESNAPQVLKCFDGLGAVRVLESDACAVLLEYIDGEKLSELVCEGQDEKATNIICDVVDLLHRYAGAPPKVHDMRRQFRSLFLRAKSENPESIYFKAAKIAEELLATEGHQRLLHGDIHHANILNSSTRGWLALDPQGVYGERTYEVANSFFNPDNRPEITEVPHRIESLAQTFSQRLKIEKKRVLQFAFVHGGLSSSWQLDDGADPSRRLRITKLIGELL